MPSQGQYISAPGAETGLRIVHISDTHGKHWERKDLIPEGDILIHSGDIADIRDDEDYCRILRDFNDFLGSLPHRFKIYVSGNHEARIAAHSATETQALLTNAIYLEHRSVAIEGLTIFGTPWTNAGRGFARRLDDLAEIWRSIPSNVDILVTHMPPFNVLDTAWEGKGRGPSDVCSVCQRSHPQHNHWGCPALYKEVTARIRPQYHLFGHNHDETGVVKREDVIFCNAAMDLGGKPIVFTVQPRQQLQTPTSTLTEDLAQESEWALQSGAMVHKASGKVLDIDRADPRPGALVHLWALLTPERKQQQWTCTDDGLIVSALNGLVLHADEEAKGPRMQPASNSPAQRWRIDKASGCFRNEAGFLLRCEDGGGLQAVRVPP